MSNNITTVRQHLLDTLADLRNREKPMDIDRARAVAEVASVLVESAKVEVAYIKVLGEGDTEFLSVSAPDNGLPPGITDVRQHRIK